MRKRLTAAALAIALVCSMLGCSAGKNEAAGGALTITDYNGRTLEFERCPERVVALMGSFGEMWLDAGGELVGITDDALDERGIDAKDMSVVGTVKNPNIEMIVSLAPDFVILSADTASQLETAQTLDNIGIKYGSFHVELFDDYLSLLKDFTALTGRADLYEKNGTDIKAQIDDTLSKAEDFSGETALLLRAYSTGWRAKDSGTLAGAIIADFGFENVIERYDSALEEISLEEIAAIDPDYIFVTIMGSNIEGTLQMLSDKLESSPVWASLAAVKADRFFVLPQELFHLKPNTRWGESYSYLANLLSNQETG